MENLVIEKFINFYKSLFYRLFYKKFINNDVLGLLVPKLKQDKFLVLSLVGQIDAMIEFLICV